MRLAAYDYEVNVSAVCKR
ncbi:Protein of unknown function [Bacillus mycoides]|uniref:Uncharacterized protein n=1 Tax=Bacillus mycoides TaxID=1405 RepID=A0A1C4G8Y6_BACMY|nr:Protein of unknown function [Bacillus mycoides]SCC64660.1 Protein of unknown function [Bacillus mycoides]SCM90169.1 Protein of unknown function [Bacillus mycoides]SCM98768.1 Protein of unknown function [Bacillus mycoides]